MKNRSNFIFIIISISIIILICIVSFGTSSSSKGESINENSDLLTKAKRDSENVKNKKDFKKINVDEYLELYNGNSLSMVFIGKDNCEYCKIAEPIVQNIMYENDLEVYYLSTNEFTEESESKFLNSNDMLSPLVTPLLLVVSNGEIIDSAKGLTDLDGYKELFINNGFIRK